MKNENGFTMFFLKYVRQYSFAVLMVILLLAVGQTVNAQEITPADYGQLKYRWIGPAGNRVIATCGVPGDNNICYVGAASGGIWKSIDGGINWDPVFDDTDVSSVSALAIAPSDPNVIWAGTGETFIRNDISVGNGVYRSTDAGANWERMGLEHSGRIPRIIIHPTDLNTVYVAAMGHCHGPQKEKGVYRTRDGGKIWEKVLFVDENTGCGDFVMDPNNPRILIAGMWPMEFSHWSRNSGGWPTGGLFMSRDGGDSWTKLKNGLPEPPTGKIALAMTADNSNRVYALIESRQGVLWRSDDGGYNWKVVSKDNNLHQRPIYYTRLAASPDDHNEVITVAVRTSISRDGGESFERLSIKGGDSHDIWIDPKNPDRILIANDQYIAISTNHGQSWSGVRLPVAQMYHVAVDNAIPYYVYGNKQDGSSFRGPSFYLGGRGGIPSTIWHSVGGAESGFAVPDPVDNNIVWSGNYQGILDRYDRRTGHSRGVAVWREDNIGAAPKDLRYRFQWTFPITISPHDHNKVYVGSQHVHVTKDGGQSWQVISPDLSANDQEMLERNHGPLTNESADPSMACAIFSIAESPLEEGQIWAGTHDGLLQVTRDGGKTWTNVTKNIPNFPPRGKITNIEPSRYDAGCCYFSCDLHEMNHWETYIYKTSDYGKSWKWLGAGVPKSYLSYAHIIREDPVRRGLLYLGTENQVYASFDDGNSWQPLRNNMPPAPVHWMVIQEHFNDLVVGTYGRGFWIMDDITPLQQMTADVLKKLAHLFKPRDAYRFMRTEGYDTIANDQCMGQNPEYGASINYFLNEALPGNVVIQVEDEYGKTVRTLSGGSAKGVNRVMWDLNLEALQSARLRVSPIGSPHVKVGPQGWRRPSDWGGPIRVQALPGYYTVKLKLNDRELSQTLEVRKDPNTTGTLADIKEQYDLLMKIRAGQNDVISMVNQSEWLRKQLYDLKNVLKSAKGFSDVITEIEKFDEKIISVEWKLVQLKNADGGQDALRWPAQLYTKFSSLAGEVNSGDFRPTDQSVELYNVLNKQLDEHKSCFQAVVSQDLIEFNNLLKSKNLSSVILVKE